MSRKIITIKKNPIIKKREAEVKKKERNEKKRRREEEKGGRKVETNNKMSRNVLSSDNYLETPLSGSLSPPPLSLILTLRSSHFRDFP